MLGREYRADPAYLKSEAPPRDKHTPLPPTTTDFLLSLAGGRERAVSMCALCVPVFERGSASPGSVYISPLCVLHPAAREATRALDGKRARLIPSLFAVERENQNEGDTQK